jgi:sirohydrochlorin ferrochelatase
VFNSRSGPEFVPWLEPDVNDHLEALAEQGVPAVVVVPIGFISDHMEVIYDLDVEARETAERLGLPFAGRDGRGRPAVRRDDPRAGARTARGRAGAGARHARAEPRRLPGRLLLHPRPADDYARE